LWCPFHNLPVYSFVGSQVALGLKYKGRGDFCFPTHGEREGHFTVFYRRETVKEVKQILRICPWVQGEGAVADLRVKPVAKFAIMGYPLLPCSPSSRLSLPVKGPIDNKRVSPLSRALLCQ